MAVTQIVFIYSSMPPFSLCATVITDDNDHPGVPHLQRPECSPAGYSFNGLPCAAMTMPVQQYQKLTVPIEADVTLLTAIGVAVGVPYVPPPPPPSPQPVTVGPSDGTIGPGDGTVSL